MLSVPRGKWLSASETGIDQSIVRVAVSERVVAAPTADSGGRHRFRRLAGPTLSAACVIAATMFLIGLVRFADSLPRTPPAGSVADAIVVLTGGENRVARAVDLILSGKGRRLLISGVNDRTSASAIATAVDENQAIFECCIDIDRRARNTVGNATEIARWVREHGYRSLIVVTGAYHMPRALNELRSVLPDTELIPDPVLAPGIDLNAWWSDERTARLIVFEYAKFLVSEVRTRLSFANPANRNL
jgi:uncharacterized SAM-binding protein YcdF (DUF218 family)